MPNLELEQFFSSEGPLAKVIAGYSPRAAQIEMAGAVAEAINANRHLIAEAGTGTGNFVGQENHYFNRHKKPAGSVVFQGFTDNSQCFDGSI